MVEAIVTRQSLRGFSGFRVAIVPRDMHVTVVFVLQGPASQCRPLSDLSFQQVRHITLCPKSEQISLFSLIIGDNTDKIRALRSAPSQGIYLKNPLPLGYAGNTFDTWAYSITTVYKYLSSQRRVFGRKMVSKSSSKVITPYPNDKSILKLASSLSSVYSDVHLSTILYPGSHITPSTTTPL